MIYKLRYVWARASGSIRRFLLLSPADSRTLSEIIYELECDPKLRGLMRDARRKLKREATGDRP